MAGKGDINKKEIQPEFASSWLTISFESVLEKTSITHKLKSKDFFSEGLYPVVDQGGNLISGFINDVSKLYNGELPIVVFGDHTRNIKFIDFKFAVGADGTKILKAKKGINDKFLYYYLLSLNIPDFGYSRHYSIFKELDFPLPPLAEQERIVTKLDTLFAQHEIMKKALNRIPQLLKDFRQQVLTQAVTGKLTEQWRKGKSLLEWKIDIIKNITSKLGSGSTPRGGSDTYLAEGIPLVRSMNIVFGGIKLHGLAFINESQAKALRNSEIQFEDILLNITGASIGRLCLADKIVTGGRVNQHVFIIRPWTDIVLPKYLESYLCSNLIQRFIEEKKYGAGMEAISKNQIENFEINLPPLQEQQEIVCRIESLFGKADAIEVRYIKLKEKITSLPQALLHKAFKGELVPQLPTDGDAKDLLAEIMALKKEVKKKK
ncbi:restriction endonuclease subunit S [Sphingobacterium faecium]|uniref:restriction endonuclease subunit S n=1 Tax=Sphingobacterium faecium TaxID=34087 RepID=UPI00246924C9|nr:restriction endonuclease subunit S [Sphingobacterium faecium]MDH5827325.1 restriction endonuclease subunit S [Sphingobacterium faecium]